MLHAPPVAAAPAFAAAALLQKSYGGGGGLAHTIPKKRTTTTTPEYEFSQAYTLEIQPIPPPPPETTTSKPKPKPKPTTTTTTTTAKPKPKPKPTTSSVTGIPIPLSTTTTPPTTSKAEATTSESIIPSPGADRDSQPISTGFSNNNTGLIVGVVLGVLAIVAMVTGLLFWKRRNRRRADEVRKVDLYQQQRMMSGQNAFTDGGRDRDHDRGGLSFHGLMSSSSHGKQVVRDIQDPQRGGGGRKGYDRQIQQPDWWVRKTPLEYQQQVPPLEVLERMAERKQEHDTKGTHHADSAMAARNSVDLTEQRRHISQESIAMHSTQQKTPSKNRLSPIRPISPIGSVFKNITGSSLTPRPTRVHNSPPQQSGYTGHGNAANPTPNQYYHPPPPLPPVPISSEQTGSLPSPGFYDFIPLDNETEQTMPVVHKTAGVTPPPIPRATRPSLNLARGLILGLDQGPSTINQRLSTNVTKVAPMTTTPPQLDMQWSDSPSKAHSKGIQLSPISSYNSDMSSLPSAGAGVGPRMGGRRPRTKSKSSNMDASI
ncbi:hypothetical protein BGZ50_003396 [Haplosporangium sp. Z 11]|nr:hypothetical protein BGZ50_003396 [Haplosporangium sp. Z 11]